MNNGWRFYNYAMIPTTAPHEMVKLESLKSGKFWKSKTALFARWTSEYDCGYKTNWWYVIKDSPLDIESLKSKRRYEVKKGQKNFDVREIIAKNFCNQIFIVTEEAYKEYPEKYRPSINKASFLSTIEEWGKYRVYGAFDRESGELCGYARLKVHQNYVDFSTLKTIPTKEKKGINAAIVSKIVMDFNEKLSGSFYICDGSRTLLHETNFQDYLEKYFGFRKAYCKLNIQYRGMIGMVVKLLYPIRGVFKGNRKLTARVKTLLKYEEIRRDM